MIAFARRWGPLAALCLMSAMFSFMVGALNAIIEDLVAGTYFADDANRIVWAWRIVDFIIFAYLWNALARLRRLDRAVTRMQAIIDAGPTKGV